MSSAPADARAPSLLIQPNACPRQRPIGVFDSGMGGLSVLRALREELPHEDFVYISDSGFAPYGERGEAFVLDRSRRIARHLTELTPLPIKALVIACNTATAAAIAPLRAEHPDLPIIGIEPALKPAAALSQTKRIGVMATRGTLNSQKFQTLLASLGEQATFFCQPCDGLADAIEHDNTSKVIALCQEYIWDIGSFGLKTGEVDTLVLGCTHYPFANTHLQASLPQGVNIISNGHPVARQTRRVLTDLGAPDVTSQIYLHSTGDCASLSSAAQRWLGWNHVATPLAL